MGVFLLDDLVTYYKCDETSGNRIDAHTNGLDMAQTGFVGSVAGKVNLALAGTGNSSNYLDRASTPLLLPGDTAFTVSGWQQIKTGENVQDNVIFAVYETTGNQRSWVLKWDNSDNRYVFSISADGSAVTNVLWGTVTALNTYHHVVAMYDPVANLAKLSVNNNPFVTQPHSGGAYASSTARPVLGGYRVSSFVVSLGDIDEVGYWARELNTEELTELQTAPSFDSFVSSTPAGRVNVNEATISSRFVDEATISSRFVDEATI